MRLFVLVIDIGENLWAFLSGDGDVFFLFEDAFDFFVLKLFFAFVESVHDGGESVNMSFGVVFVELVILDNGLVLILVLFQIIKPPHELFFLIR